VSKYRPHSLEEVDVELEEAIERLRDKVRHIRHGRVIVTVERFRAETVGYRVGVDPMTEDDMERLMREPPQGDSRGRRR
jgi:diphthamide synthase (EF-2-diphthine--ammonia ligase)